MHHVSGNKYFDSGRSKLIQFSIRRAGISNFEEKISSVLPSSKSKNSYALEKTNKHNRILDFAVRFATFDGSPDSGLFLKIRSCFKV